MRLFKITHRPNSEAVNDIFASMTDVEKRFLAGSVVNDMVPNEYVSREKYEHENALLNTSIIWEGDIPIAFCDVWLNRPQEGDISIGTRNGKEYRNKGYATLAINEAIRWFNKFDGLNVLCYYTHVNNKSSILFVQKLGFKIFFQDEQITGLELQKNV